jgi:hypothetical protein
LQEWTPLQSATGTFHPKTSRLAAKAAPEGFLADCHQAILTLRCCFEVNSNFLSLKRPTLRSCLHIMPSGMICPKARLTARSLIIKEGLAPYGADRMKYILVRPIPLKRS